MDIVVTIPKTEYDNNILERKAQNENPDMYGFRVFHRMPKKLNIEDRIYFVRGGKVAYSKVIFEIEEREEYFCEVTLTGWYGKYVIKFRDERNEKHLNIKIKGFQGFRYRWWGDKI